VTDEDGAATGDTWSIEPGTVTINTLTINGKQVTVDVFRQLKEAVLINHDGSLAGSPWGLVNYHQKDATSLRSMRMWCGSWVINFAKTPSRPRDGSRSGPPPVVL
jgi:hypothetical protein